MLPSDAESLRAAELVNQSWPDQAYDAMAVAVLHRPGGLTEADRQYALCLAQRFQGAGRTGCDRGCARPDIGARDRRTAGKPGRRRSRWWRSCFRRRSWRRSSHEAVAWMERQAKAATGCPQGLEIRWTGDAVIGRDYMANVQTSLDRAAVATVVLLLIVLLAVYRSFWLALVPLVTIGVSLVISRGVLAWMMLAGWELSPLVELS